MTNTQHTEISATPAAVSHIQKMIAKQGYGIGMRLSIKDSGCSGKKYVVALVKSEEINPDDHVYLIGNDLKICVDPKSFVYIAGVEIDYVKKNLNGNFVFHNPNEKASCGCGESFYV
jgi:iron-sulfur cluster assembly protein